MAQKKKPPANQALDETEELPHEVSPDDEAGELTQDHLLTKRRMDQVLNRTTKVAYARAVMVNIRENMPVESACYAAGIFPEELQEWVNEDKRMKLSIMRQVALAERDLIRKVNEGGQGMSQAKSALEILTRLHKAWAAKTQVSLHDNLKDALDELEREFDGPTYERILRIIQRNAS